MLFIIIVLGYPKMKEPNFWLKLKGRNARIRKTYIICFLLYGVSSRKKVCFRRNRAKKWDRVVKKVHEEICLLRIEIFWMSNKTIIKSSFRMLWRIIPIWRLLLFGILLDLQISSHNILIFLASFNTQRVLPHIIHIGMCRPDPKGYGFWSGFVWKLS